MRLKTLPSVVFLLLIFCLVLGDGARASADNERSLSLGFKYGTVGSIADEAVKGYLDTKFQSGTIYGCNLLYGKKSGTALEVRVQRFTMELTGWICGESPNYGEIEANQILLIPRGQIGRTEGGSISGYIDGGVGYSFNKFKKGPVYEDVGFTTENSIVFQVGGGIETFFARQTISLNTEAQLQLANAQVKVKNNLTKLMKTDTLQLNNFSLSIGLRYWIDL